MKSEEYSILVIELDDEEPRRISSHPNLVVVKTTEKPEERFSQLLQGKSNKWFLSRMVKLREDLMPNTTFSTGEKANEEMERLKKSLKQQGFTIGQDRRVWQVYVVKLERDGYPDNYVYVGSTSKTPEERLQEHKDGKRNNKGGPLFSRKVKKYGTVLLYDLFPEDNIFLTQDSALKFEKDYAKKLKKDGFKVEQG